MRIMQVVMTLLGRLFISSIFILSAANKLLDWQGTERDLVSLFYEWSGYVGDGTIWKTMFAQLLPWVPLILITAIVVEILGGILILFGIKARFGAFLLILFFIPTTILFHQFWFLEGVKRDMQIILFMKNIAILGGLFYVLAYGASVGKKTKPKGNDSAKKSD